MDDPTTRPSPPIDRQRLIDLYGPLADELGAELVEEFQSDARAFVETLHRLDLPTDLEQTALTSHTIKGSAGALGALRLGELAAQLEDASRARNTAAATEAKSAVIQELARFYDLRFDDIWDVE